MDLLKFPDDSKNIYESWITTGPLFLFLPTTTTTTTTTTTATTTTTITTATTTTTTTLTTPTRPPPTTKIVVNNTNENKKKSQQTTAERKHQISTPRSPHLVSQPCEPSRKAVVAQSSSWIPRLWPARTFSPKHDICRKIAFWLAMFVYLCRNLKAYGKKRSKVVRPYVCITTTSNACLQRGRRPTDWAVIHPNIKLHIYNYIYNIT